jgi:potassium efflux system protein
MRTVRNLLIGVARSAVWPAYLALAAYAARQAPWPKTLALPLAVVLASLALAALAANIGRRLLGPGCWAEGVLGMPPEVCRMVRRALVALLGSSVLILLPAWLLSGGLIAPGGRPVPAPAVVRALILGFELVVMLIAWRVVRHGSALIGWLERSPARLGRLARHRRKFSAAVVGWVAAVIALDARGYSFSARRLATGALGSMVVAAASWGLYRLLLRAIDHHAWRWVKVGWVISGRAESDDTAMPDDVAGRLRQLSAYLAGAVGLVLAAWVWDVDLALFRFISEQEVWPVDGKAVVTVGDLSRALAVVAVCVVAWRHMSTFFAVVVFPRIPDDPGIRFAVVTLCRYAVVGVGLLCVLSAVHLGLEKIGVVLAALGVGLGFGLQEIVSNFVCGIILLLERPIRVGDIVTAAGMTGKVDRINIRATSIINGDNQSMIIPNRAFITGDLINWTLKDKVIRVSVRVKVARGTDPDRVCELLLAIARDDADVLRNPVPAALMEEISDTALVFALHTHVPEPSLAGRVKHRLYGQIQQRFGESGVVIPLPSQELLIRPFEASGVRAFPAPGPGPIQRFDTPAPTPPGPLGGAPPRPMPEPVEDCHRGVDE